MSMSENKQPNQEERDNAFSHEAQQGQVGFFVEFWDFLIHNKKWWITPIAIVLLLVGILVMLGGTAAAPFIYTLF
jgi:hypothetical protein